MHYSTSVHDPLKSNNRSKLFITFICSFQVVQWLLYFEVIWSCCRIGNLSLAFTLPCSIAHWSGATYNDLEKRIEQISDEEFCKGILAFDFQSVLPKDPPIEVITNLIETGFVVSFSGSSWKENPRCWALAWPLCSEWQGVLSCRRKIAGRYSDIPLWSFHGFSKGWDHFRSKFGVDEFDSQTYWESDRFMGV